MGKNAKLIRIISAVKLLNDVNLTLWTLKKVYYRNIKLEDVICYILAATGIQKCDFG